MLEEERQSPHTVLFAADDVLCEACVTPTRTCGRIHDVHHEHEGSDEETDPVGDFFDEGAGGEDEGLPLSDQRDVFVHADYNVSEFKVLPL